MLAPGTAVGRYRVVTVLGRGGMSTVYQATDEAAGRSVALKVLGPELEHDAEFVRRFRREGRLHASLTHAHVVAIYEAGESEWGLFLAMRLVRGPTLAALLADGALGGERAIDLAGQIAGALDAAHAAGLVHRDVKPRNVLVGASDHGYLADFGLTRLDGSTAVTVTGQLVGTLAYLAPEVIRGEPATPASDCYSFAAMLFECLSGSVVFPRTSHAAVLFAHASEPPPRISRRRDELPEALDDVFARALAKAPGERPRSAEAIVRAVGDVLTGPSLAALGPPRPPFFGGADATIESPSPPAAPRAHGRPWAALLAAAGVVAGTALGAGIARRPAEPVPPVAAPRLLAGASPLGSDLERPGAARDCRGDAAGPGSPGCVVRQAALPGATVVVPADGVVRRWEVRSARGELALAILRRREGKVFPVSYSRHEFVADGGVHAFATDLAVDGGDLVGLRLLPGSGIGVAGPVRGAASDRWLGRLNVARAPDFSTGNGFDAELLLRVEYVAGARQQLPAQVTGARAAHLPPGRVRIRRRARFRDGRPVVLGLVELSDRFALDLFAGGRRVARIDVPELRPGGGRVLAFDVEVEPSEREQLNLQVDYVAADSARILTHSYSAYAREFEFGS